ncbi:MAG: SDR family NAD(P)-dependent oxidoreductase, partial [Vicinamibacterales bacterium]
MSDTIVVITGASGGIGAAVAEMVSRQGMSVVLAARRKDALDAVAAKCVGPSLPVVADVAVRANVRRIV